MATPFPKPLRQFTGLAVLEWLELLLAGQEAIYGVGALGVARLLCKKGNL